MSEGAQALRLRNTEEAVPAPYHYTACGLDNIYLLSGYALHRTPYGPGVSVKDADGLHRAIGLSLAERKKVLQPKELKWLRRHLDLTQSELARLLGCDSQTVARWEKGHSKAPGSAERIIRLLYVNKARKRPDLRTLLEGLDASDDVVEAERPFEAAPDGWRMARGASTMRPGSGPMGGFAG